MAVVFVTLVDGDRHAGGILSCRGWRRVETDTSWVGEAVMVMGYCPGVNYCRMSLHGCGVCDTSG